MVNPIHTDPTVQHVDVRFYFDRQIDHDIVLDSINKTLTGCSYDLAAMLGAYEMVADGFGRLVPDDKPLA